MMKSDLQKNLMPMMALMAITIINTGITVAFILNLAVGITSSHLVTLVSLEIVAVILALRQSKRRRENALF